MKSKTSFFVLGGAAVLVVLVILGVFLWSILSRPSASALDPWLAPQDAVNLKAMRPVHALFALADENDAAAIEDTLAQGDWEAALALLAYSPAMSDTTRVGNLLLVASRLAGTRPPAVAARAYDYAIQAATLSPALTDLTRAQNLLQASNGLKGLDEPDAARRAAGQAYLIARHSPYLPAAERARLLRQVGDTYQRLGATALAAQARTESNTAAITPDDQPLPAESTALPAAGPLPADAGLQAAIQDRLQSARALRDELSPDSRDLPADRVLDLASRLFDEDAKRQAYYTSQLKTAKDSPTRIALLRSQVEWTALKWRVARQGFGFSLLPEWENDVTGIENALSVSLNALFQEEEGAAAQGAPAARDRALERELRRELLLSRWGFDPGYDESALRARLDEVTGRLRDQNSPGLYLDSFRRGNAQVYILVPEEAYGTGEKALPQ